jgi:hypothetical protein
MVILVVFANSVDTALLIGSARVVDCKDIESGGNGLQECYRSFSSNGSGSRLHGSTSPLMVVCVVRSLDVLDINLKNEVRIMHMRKKHQVGDHLSALFPYFRMLPAEDFRIVHRSCRRAPGVAMLVANGWPLTVEVEHVARTGSRGDVLMAT